MSNVPHFKRQLWSIEIALGTLNPRDPADLPHLRKLADDHMVYRECLRREGVIVPSPRIDW